MALRGDVINVASLSDAEQKFVAKLNRQAGEHPDWNEFTNYWTHGVADFHKDKRFLSG